MSEKLSKKDLADRIQALCVLVVDDNQYMRKIIRNLLVNCGVKDIYEAGDGIAALDTIRTVGPDVVILDWEMPLLNGAELVRIGGTLIGLSCVSRGSSSPPVRWRPREPTRAYR